jgi:hypothetical protein
VAFVPVEKQLSKFGSITNESVDSKKNFFGKSRENKFIETKFKNTKGFYIRVGYIKLSQKCRTTLGNSTYNTLSQFHLSNVFFLTKKNLWLVSWETTPPSA